MSEVESVAPVSPLGGVSLSHGLSARIEELDDRGMITLRAAAGDAARALEAVGLTAPEARRSTRNGDRRAVWMAPDEWLLCAPRDEIAGMLATLERALDGVQALALDVSDARATFRLTGAGARATLAKGAPVDMASFAPGQARRSHLGQVACALWMTGAEPDAFELVCFRSVAAYVLDWLLASADADADPGRF
jgi:sarcosine oxidase subunit gamma